MRVHYMTVENIEFLIFLAGSRCTVCYSFIHRNNKSLSRGSQPNLGHGLSSLSPFSDNCSQNSAFKERLSCFPAILRDARTFKIFIGLFYDINE